MRQKLETIEILSLKFDNDLNMVLIKFDSDILLFKDNKTSFYKPLFHTCYISVNLKIPRCR